MRAKIAQKFKLHARKFKFSRNFITLIERPETPFAFECHNCTEYGRRGRYKLSSRSPFYSFHDTLSIRTHTYTWHSKLTLKPLRDTGKPPQCHVSVSLVFFFLRGRIYSYLRPVGTYFLVRTCV